MRIIDDTLTPTLEAFDERSRQIVRILLNYWVSRLVTHMRQNAPWTDRTTAARNGLSARVVERGENMSLVLYHTVPYGVFLEVRWSGRYAIIGPTMRQFSPRVLQHVGEGLMRHGS